MVEFIGTYGLWIVLGVVFIAMHRFGKVGGGGHGHGRHEGNAPPTPEAPKTPGSPAGTGHEH